MTLTRTFMTPHSYPVSIYAFNAILNAPTKQFLLYTLAPDTRLPIHYA